MEEYVNQLIEDIQDAVRMAPEQFVFAKDDEEFMHQMVESESTPPVDSEKLMGLIYLQFPPADRLTVEQIIKLNSALEKTFEAFRIYIELPQGVPVELRYEMIRDLFKDKFHIKKGLNLHLDFCSGDCPPCPIANYCQINLNNMKRNKV